MSTVLRRSSPPVGLALATALLFCCVFQTAANAPSSVAPEAIFTVQAEDHQAIVRVITRAPQCPGIQWDEKPPVAMTVRALPATIAGRNDTAQKDHKSVVFDVMTCEADWPAGTQKARIAGRTVAAPKAVINRIVIIADTGCRMKASEDAFQPCNDAKKWPFAQIAESAAAQKPDLVIHIGDIHYRESPCPATGEDCANSPWGYGFDAWAADLFKPAKPLLEAAPWVFVRGNHEVCSRAGQGWFRFVDRQPWREARSCNDPRLDPDADYSDPYAVAISPETQFVVFDSANTSGKPLASTSLAYSKYLAQMLLVDQLSRQKPHSFFLSHHPLLAVAPGHVADKIKAGGNAGLQSVLQSAYPTRLLPEGIEVAMHGHLHYFEALSFKTAHPASFVLGNSSSSNEKALATSLPADFQPYPGAVVEDYAARKDYGFATLDRIRPGASGQWLLTEYSATGEPVFRCKIQNSKNKCTRVAD